MNEAKTEPGS